MVGVGALPESLPSGASRETNLSLPHKYFMTEGKLLNCSLVFSCIMGDGEPFLSIWWLRAFVGEMTQSR